MNPVVAVAHGVMGYGESVWNHPPTPWDRRSTEMASVGVSCHDYDFDQADVSSRESRLSDIRLATVSVSSVWKVKVSDFETRYMTYGSARRNPARVWPC